MVMHACTNMHDFKPKHEDILNVFSSNFFRVDFFLSATHQL